MRRCMLLPLLQVSLLYLTSCCIGFSLSQDRHSRKNNARPATSSNERSPLLFLPPLQLDQTISFSKRRHDAFGKQIRFEVKRISNTPHMFLFRNFVSKEERNDLIRRAQNDPKDLVDYNSNNNNNRRRSLVSWFSQDDPISISLANSATKLILGKTDDKNENDMVVSEELQIVKYNPQGEFKLHHDEAGRMVTILYYLNGVAGTWFPLACPSSASGNNGKCNVDQLVLRPPPTNDEDAIQQVQDLKPGIDGILIIRNSCGDELKEEKSTERDCNDTNIVSIRPGDALVFYNYDNHDDDDSTTPKIDWRAVHAGLPASEEKWIATHWFHEKENFLQLPLLL